jgi:Ion transport protein
MLKLTRRSRTFGLLLWAVFREEAHSIAALIFTLCLTLTISGALMYMVEEEQQPAIFNSIPAATWWAIETLTTVGYGDMVPTTIAGRVLGGIVSIVGIGTLALFSGLITVGFLDQLKTRRDQPQDQRVIYTQDGERHLRSTARWSPRSATGFVRNADMPCPNCTRGATIRRPRGLSPNRTCRTIRESSITDPPRDAHRVQQYLRRAPVTQAILNA